MKSEKKKYFVSVVVFLIFHVLSYSIKFSIISDNEEPIKKKKAFQDNYYELLQELS